jgi:2-polyprenyl-3-methyl-5-hydroxy-6-metoxy-1,4-benzoquinol methylase
MQKNPSPEIYDSFYRITSWGLLMQNLIEYITNNAPRNANILDLMCGTGYLLNIVSKKRKDLICEGIDLNKEFIEYAQTKKSDISFKIGDVLKWESNKEYDIIVCSGGIHHLRDEDKDIFINRIAVSLDKKGVAILADPYINDYTNETERKLSVAKLGYEYIRYAIEKQALDKELEAVIDILYNDILDFEHKTSISKMRSILNQYFKHIVVTKVWGVANAEIGDYYIICKNYMANLNSC